jgi:hypothetical protein
MSRNIDDGVNKIAEILRDSHFDEQTLHSWRDLRNKIDSQLLSTNVITTNEAKRKCMRLDTLNDEKRKELIANEWGPLYLQKVEPLLHQLSVLEKQMLNEGD